MNYSYHNEVFQLWRITLLSLEFLDKSIFLFLFIISDGKKHGTVTSAHASLTYSKIVVGPFKTKFEGLRTTAKCLKIALKKPEQKI